MKPALLAAAIAGVLAILPALLGQFYYGLDLTRVDVPFISELKAAIARGHGFYVTPAIGNGEPFLADPEAQLFYPLRWLQALVPLGWAASVGIAFHLAIAASGAAFLALTFGIEATIALAVGLLFVLGGTTIDLIRHTVFILDAAWLPWLWAGGRTVLLGSSRRGSVILFVSAAALMLGGEPMGLVMGLMLLTIEAAFTLRSREGRLRAGIVAASVAAAIGASLVLWIPALSELSIASHGEGFRLEASLRWSLEWCHLLAAALPGLLTHWVGEGSAHFTFWQVYNSWLETNRAVGGAWNFTPYIGVVALVALGCAVSLRRARPLAIGLALGCILALGANTPALPALMTVLPPLRHFRFPAKYFIVASLAAAVLAGVALDALRAGEIRIARFRKAFGAVFGVAILSFLATIVIGDRSPTAMTLKDPLLHVAAVSATVLIVLFRVPERAAKLVPLIAVLDVLVASFSILPLGADLTAVPSVVAGVLAPASAKDPAVLCVHSGLAGLRLGETAQGQDENDWDNYLAERVFAVPNLNACDGIVSGMPYSVMASGSRRLLREGVDTFKLPQITALGCTHLLTPAPPGAVPGVRADAYQAVSAPRLENIRMSNGHLGLWALRDPVPAVFVAKNPRLFEETGPAMERVAASSPGDVVGVLEDPMKQWPSTRPLPSGEGVTGVEAQGDVDALTLRIQGSGGAVVGVRKTFSAGWQAWQGDSRRPVYRVAGSLIAAEVDDVAKGPVRFVYSPPHFGLGWALFALSILLEASIFIFLA